MSIGNIKTYISKKREEAGLWEVEFTDHLGEFFAFCSCLVIFVTG